MPSTIGSTNIDAVQLKDQTSISTPASGYKRLYAKSGGLYFKDSAGVEHLIGSVDTSGIITITQTYSTTATTLNAYTTDAESGAYTGAADSEAKLADLNALRVAYENLRASHDNALGVLNTVINILQAAGMIG